MWCNKIKKNSTFQIKDKTKIAHKHDLVYHFKHPECQEDYIGQIHKRIYEQICDHMGKDIEFH